MSDKMSERVLVIPTRHFHQLGLFQGLNQQVDHYLPDLLTPEMLSFRPRGEVENDPSFKQIIPYVVLRWQNEAFFYVRGKQGTEARLQQLLSIGIGGHVAEEDTQKGEDVYRQGMLREVEEEIYLESRYSEKILGLINDDRTPVGEVHLGIVHVFDLETPKVQPKEEGLIETGFAPMHDLMARRAEMETWSQFTLDAL